VFCEAEQRIRLEDGAVARRRQGRGLLGVRDGCVVIAANLRQPGGREPKPDLRLQVVVGGVGARLRDQIGQIVELATGDPRGLRPTRDTRWSHSLARPMSYEPAVRERNLHVSLSRSARHVWPPTAMAGSVRRP
jgi:hypothetical protein